MSLDLWDLPTYMDTSDSDSDSESESGGAFEEEFLLPFEGQQGGGHPWEEPYILYSEGEFTLDTTEGGLKRVAAHGEGNTEVDVLLRRPILLSGKPLDQIVLSQREKEKQQKEGKGTLTEKKMEDLTRLTDILKFKDILTGMTPYACLKYFLQMNEGKRNKEVEKCLVTEEEETVTVWQAGGGESEVTLDERIRTNLQKKHKGLKNCGNTCYFNSMLQMLSYIPDFVEEIKGTELFNLFEQLYSGETGVIDPSGIIMHIIDFIYVDNLLHTYLNDINKPITEENIKNDIKNIDNIKQSSKLQKDIFNNFNKDTYDKLSTKVEKYNHLKNYLEKQQQDADEFLKGLYSYLKLDVEKGNLSYLKVTLENTKKCTEGVIPTIRTDIQSITLNTVTEIILPLIREHSLNKLLNDYQKETTLDKDNWVSGCSGGENGKGPSSSQYTIKPDGEYIMIMLKRLLQGKKIDFDVPIENDITFDKKTYSLEGYIVHRGGSTSGHYVFYKKTDAGYILYDDDKVNPEVILYDDKVNPEVKLPELEKSYILLYKRKDLLSPTLLEKLSTGTGTPLPPGTPPGAGTRTPQQSESPIVEHPSQAAPQLQIIPEKQYAVLSMIHGMLAIAQVQGENLPKFQEDLYKKYEWVANKVQSKSYPLLGILGEKWNKVWTDIQTNYLKIPTVRMSFDEFCEMLQDPKKVLSYMMTNNLQSSAHPLEDSQQQPVPSAPLEDPQQQPVLSAPPLEDSQQQPVPSAPLEDSQLQQQPQPQPTNHTPSPQEPTGNPSRGGSRKTKRKVTRKRTSAHRR